MSVICNTEGIEYKADLVEPIFVYVTDLAIVKEPKKDKIYGVLVDGKFVYYTNPTETAGVSNFKAVGFDTDSTAFKLVDDLCDNKEEEAGEYKYKRMYQRTFVKEEATDGAASLTISAEDLGAQEIWLHEGYYLNAKDTLAKTGIAMPLTAEGATNADASTLAIAKVKSDSITIDFGAQTGSSMTALTVRYIKTADPVLPSHPEYLLPYRPDYWVFVDSFTNVTGDPNKLYWLKTEYTEGGKSYARGVYTYSSTTGFVPYFGGGGGGGGGGTSYIAGENITITGNVISAKDTKYKAGEGIEINPTDNKISAPVMTGATETADGVKGLVPAPTKGPASRYLNAKGEWVEVDADVIAFVDSLDVVTKPSKKKIYAVKEGNDYTYYVNPTETAGAFVRINDVDIFEFVNDLASVTAPSKQKVYVVGNSYYVNPTATAGAFVELTKIPKVIATVSPKRLTVLIGTGTELRAEEVEGGITDNIVPFATLVRDEHGTLGIVARKTATTLDVLTISYIPDTHFYATNGTSSDGNYNNDGATGAGSFAVGVNASAAGENAMAIGMGAKSDGKKSIVIGDAETSGNNSTIIGGASDVQAMTNTKGGALLIGRGIVNKMATVLVISRNFLNEAAKMITQIGYRQNVPPEVQVGDFSTTIGLDAVGSGAESVAIGHNAIAEEANTVSFGNTKDELNALTGKTNGVEMYRRIVKIGDGVGVHDALTVGQFSKLYLTKAQMVAVVDDTMPNRFITVCQDDGRLYVYDKSIATPSAETGKFVLLTDRSFALPDTFSLTKKVGTRVNISKSFIKDYWDTATEYQTLFYDTEGTVALVTSKSEEFLMGEVITYVGMGARIFLTTETLSTEIGARTTVTAEKLPDVSFDDIVVGLAIIADGKGTLGIVLGKNGTTSVSVQTTTTSTPTKELKKAEYDALTEEEKNNGTIYFITDQGGGGGGGGVAYTAGDNIQISADNVISATDTKYTAGTGISISDQNVITATGEAEAESIFDYGGATDMNVYNFKYLLIDLSSTYGVHTFVVSIDQVRGTSVNLVHAWSSNPTYHTLNLTQITVTDNTTGITATVSAGSGTIGTIRMIK